METFMKYLFQTNDNFSYWVPRVMLGCVMFPHGAQKTSWMVWWVWVYQFDDLFYPNSGFALGSRVFDYHGRIIRFARIDLRFFY